MVLFNYATRELTAKIVYYGAGLCGKTTNLEHIHQELPEKTRGKMLSLATQTDRTLFFDFLPMDLGTVKGMKTRVQLYTVPGQVFYDATRKLVLKGADGVVFVVDSQDELMERNLESWDNLKQNLAENNLDVNTIPLVIQYNKRDLPNVVGMRELNEKINILKVPYFEAIAITGVGVQESLKGITKVVLQNLQRRYAKEEVPELSQPPAVSARPGRIVKSESIAPSMMALPTDVTLDLSALEEVKDLPHADELDAGLEEAAITLEPLTESQPDNVPELEVFPELQPEMPVDSLLNEPLSDESSGAEKAPATVTAFRPAKRDVSLTEELEKIAKSSVQTKRKTEIRTTSDASQTIHVPVEVSIQQDGQEVKVQIAIELKIHLIK